MKVLFYVLSLLFSFSSVWAKDDYYKIVIFSDEGSLEEAGQFVKLMKQQRPFNYLGDKVIIEVVPLTAERMNCKNGEKIKRLITCDDHYLHKMQAKHKANLAAAYTSTAEGGSGGSIPHISKGYGSTNSGLLHEILHTFGFSDEYPYNAEEGAYYCFKKMTSHLNAAYFNDIPPYESDDAAKKIHGIDIPWSAQIGQATPITTSSDLGTPLSILMIEAGKQSAGLYKGGGCENFVKTWRPYDVSIMRALIDPTIYPIYEDRILEVMNQAGGYQYTSRDSLVGPVSCDFSPTVIEKLRRNVQELIKDISPKTFPDELIHQNDYESSP